MQLGSGPPPVGAVCAVVAAAVVVVVGATGRVVRWCPPPGSDGVPAVVSPADLASSTTDCGAWHADIAAAAQRAVRPISAALTRAVTEADPGMATSMRHQWLGNDGVSTSDGSDPSRSFEANLREGVASEPPTAPVQAVNGSE